jgi:Fuc2NAc and GlcNAc transferase
VGSELTLICVGSLVLSLVLTGLVRRLAISRGLLDLPNFRSSHSTPTPRGGGLAIVSATVVAVVVLACIGRISHGLSVAVVGGGCLVAAIGFIDDRRPVPARIRLPVHIIAAVWAVIWVGPPSTLLFGQHAIHLGWSGPVLTILGIVWTLNLFNFMDGIDGIAASEAVFVSWAAAILVLLAGGSPSVAATALAFGSACGGFLLLNWPPAKIFMGDVGSGYLGYVISVLALEASRGSPESLWTWLILGGVFFVDATLTLVRRLLRGERVYQAHRSHAYQWLARRWRSHKSVTMTVMATNLLWLLPCAALSALHPRWALWMAAVALTPLGIAVFVAGSGRSEYV